MRSTIASVISQSRPPRCGPAPPPRASREPTHPIDRACRIPAPRYPVSAQATLASGYFSLARPRSKPGGKVVKIPYCSIERIEVRASPSGSRTEFLLVCTDGKTHTFKGKTTEACERLVGNLRELRTLANR